MTLDNHPIVETSPVETLIEEVRQGRMVILMDDEDRENEGDLIMAASMVNAESINFMAKEGRGLICLTLTQERCDQLNLGLMVSQNGSQNHTNFTHSIEAAEGVSTGISAADRAHTVLTAVAPHSKPTDIVSPGHIFPIRAVPGGVLRRAGHTEAGCDLMRLAGLDPSAVIVEIMNEDGTMARRADLEKFATKFNLKLGTIADLIHYRRLHEATVERKEELKLHTRFGEFDAVFYNDLVTGEQHVALTKGNLEETDAPLVRVHLADFARDLLQVLATPEEGEQVEDDQWRLSTALEAIQKENAGAVVLIGRSMNSQKLFADTVKSAKGHDKTEVKQDQADVHYANIGTGAQILKDLGINKMRVLSSKMKFSAISGFGLEITEYIEKPQA
ncbi:MAG: 3,4-dihydroxy-2-butanone-4-phosphate synthase [Pseudomonadota bacterium]|nr:3,4-dihydroxy-2-butanone-4-phosphate synthase [Gammaproteobacteria bacterium]MEC8010239.1 3,4-dihydroxy-2-butanone-4-phosphate synthase [Pseudomonadota bacterium]HBF06730.1 3,4-dihydroxy-2-butanone-4-phosphate synthase [Gammaproteobacteria bacterium]|tara:strand:- start:458 stop:1624 length:1167 start_codon:yes stop_codon:yes gene_type:complete